MEIILASQSPRRRELLKQMGLEFEVLVPDIDERMDRALAPAELVEAISAEKAEKAAGQVDREAIIIAADTVVALNGRLLGKPADENQAREMLQALSGSRHQVYTGFTVRQGERSVTRSECTQVSFRALTAEEIEHYIATGEPMDKAGSYGIQGYGALLVEGLQGDYFNVMGLPVCSLGQVLGQFGVDCLARCAKQ